MTDRPDIKNSGKNGTETASCLPEIFRREAARYHKTFPEKLAGLLVTVGYKKIFVAPEIADLLTQNVSAVNSILKERVSTLRKKGWAAAAGRASIGETWLNHISLNGHDHHGFVSDAYPADMNQIALFDHEIGHFIVPEGDPKNSTKHMAECAADAFAALRHIQRFGNHSDLLDYAAADGAKNAVFEMPPIHYTSAVFLKIDQLQKQGAVDIASLSLAETTALAGKIARECALDENTLDRIYVAYAQVRAAGAARTPIDHTALLEAAVDVMEAHKDDQDIYRAGKLYISRACMGEAAAVLACIDTDFWDKLAALEQHEKDSGFTLLPASRAAPAQPHKKQEGNRP